METPNTILAAAFIRTLLKAKKLMHIYPSNNMIYQRAVDETYSMACDYISNFGSLMLTVRSNDITVEGKPVYHSEDRIDNLALLFFKDGIRELHLEQGIKRVEMEEFLRLLGTDFDGGDSGDDLVFAIWERGFEHIRLVVDEQLFIDNVDDVELESISARGSGIQEAAGDGVGKGSADIEQEAAGEEDGLMLAYMDGLTLSEGQKHSIGISAGDEREMITAEMKKSAAERSEKLAEIMVIILAASGSSSEASKMARHIQELVLYSLKGGAVGTLLRVLKAARGADLRLAQQGVKKQMDGIIDFCISAKVMNMIGAMLDSSEGIKEEQLAEYAASFWGDAIEPFVTMLGHLQSLHARRLVNNILIHIGKANTAPLKAGLKDHAWYVVRNIIYVLRNIGDREVLPDILAEAAHEHPRVRLEVVRALHDLAGREAIHKLSGFLDDIDSTVRLTAVSVMGSLKDTTEFDRKMLRDVILRKLAEGHFNEREMREKKAFYEALSCYGDSDTEQTMIRILGRKALFGGRKESEERACAAYYLGLVKSRAAVPLLEKLSVSGDALISEQASEALKRIVHV